MNNKIRPRNVTEIRSYEISPRPARNIRRKLTKRICTVSIVIGGGFVVHSPSGETRLSYNPSSFSTPSTVSEELDKPIRILRLNAAYPITATYQSAPSDAGKAVLGLPSEANSARFGQALLSSYAAYRVAEPNQAIDSTPARHDDGGIISVPAKPEDNSESAYTSKWIADGVLEISAERDLAPQLAGSGANGRPSDQRPHADLAYSDDRLAGPASRAEATLPAYPSAAISTQLPAADHDAADGQQMIAAADAIKEPLAGGSAQPTGTVDASLAQMSGITLTPPEAQVAAEQTAAAACDDLSDGVIDTEFTGAGSAKVAVRITADNELCLRVGDVLALLESQMEKDQFERLIGSQAASNYVSWSVLREKGLTIDFDTLTDKLVLGAR